MLFRSYSEADNATAVHLLLPESRDVSLLHAQMHEVDMHPKAHFIRGETEYMLYTSDSQLMEFTPRYVPNDSKHGTLSP